MKTIKLPIIITLAMLVGLLAFASVKPVSAATAPCTFLPTPPASSSASP